MDIVDQAFLNAKQVKLKKLKHTIKGRDAYLPIPTFYCTSCGNVNEEFIPAELKNKIQLV